MLNPWWAMGASFLGSLVMGWPVRRLMVAFGILDRPNARSSHVTVTARGGGVGILFVIVCASVAVGGAWPGRVAWAMPVAALLVGAVSFVDDMRGLPAWIRFGFHLGGAATLAWAVGGWDEAAWEVPGMGGMRGGGWILAGLMVVWMAGYTNAFNFMDGINGIASMQAGLGAMAMALVAWAGAGAKGGGAVVLCVVVSGAALGFLPHNFPRARMFMGDVGSAPLGMLLAFLALWLCREHGLGLFLPLALVHANFILDTAFTLVRRVARGDRWHEPHREHFYQRLVRAGRSHAHVTCWEAVLMVVSCGVAMAVAGKSLGVQAMGAATVVAVWSSFFGYAELVFRRSEAGRCVAAGRGR